MTKATTIYLDHNATTPVSPQALEAMLPYLETHFGNPSSGHVFGQRARDAVEMARAQVAELIGCGQGEIVFTSGGTEANNLAIRGLTAARPERKHVITSVVEHPATVGPCKYLEQRGWEVTWSPVDKDGRVTQNAIAPLVRDDTALLTIIHAQNEVGTLQPVRQFADLAHAHGALLHTDAAQSLGKVPINVDTLGVDLLSIAGHKVYAPKGIGALYVRNGTPLQPVLIGAGHEHGLRPGTENVASIVGLGRACEIVRLDLSVEQQRMVQLRDELLDLLREQIPGIELNGHPVDRLPNTLNVRIPGVSGNAVLAAAEGIAASTGSACHDGAESASPILMAMGIKPIEALGSIRLSLGRSTTKSDIVTAAKILARATRIQ